METTKKAITAMIKLKAEIMTLNPLNRIISMKHMAAPIHIESVPFPNAHATIPLRKKITPTRATNPNNTV